MKEKVLEAAADGQFEDQFWTFALLRLVNLSAWTV